MAQTCFIVGGGRESAVLVRVLLPRRSLQDGTCDGAQRPSPPRCLPSPAQPDHNTHLPSLPMTLLLPSQALQDPAPPDLQGSLVSSSTLPTTLPPPHPPLCTSPQESKRVPWVSRVSSTSLDVGSWLQNAPKGGNGVQRLGCVLTASLVPSRPPEDFLGSPLLT